MSQEKLFNQIKLESKKANITAVNIIGRNLITGENNGTINVYEIKKNKLLPVSEAKMQSKIEKICVPPDQKVAFVLSGGNVFFINVPKIENPQPLFQGKEIADIYFNCDDKKYKNMFLTIEKKGKLIIKIYQFEINDGKAEIKEGNFPKDMPIEKLPDIALWTVNDYFLYSLNNKKLYWLNVTTGNYKSKDEFDGAIDLINLDGKISVSNPMYTVFMKDGKSFSYNMILHEMADFHIFCQFQNQLIALYDNNIIVFKAGEKEYSQVEKINFDKGETGKFMVASSRKLIVLTSSGDTFHFIDFQDKPFEEKVKLLIDQKAYDKGLGTLIENVTEDDDERQPKLEEFFLDCAWSCIEGTKKDYETSIKYLNLNNFNPFEFLYMFCDELDVKIIHKDKEQNIIAKKKENQFLSPKTGKEEQKKAFEYLISILKLKREYISEILIKSQSKTENSEITFMSSNRSKISLKDSTTPITIGDTFYAINSALIKCMIKLRADPTEIETVLDDETINNSNLNDLEKDPFFLNENNKNLNETKLTLALISEKSGTNYEKVLEQYENFGKGKDEKYKLIGKNRTKKLFYQFKDLYNITNEEKENLFKKFIKWLLEIYQEEAFQIVTETELVSNKIFLEEILPGIKSGKEDLKEKFLEYCDKNHKTETYQTQLLQLYADKIFKITGKENKKKLDGEALKYYDKFMKIIQSPDNVYNKNTILQYIENSCLKEAKIILYNQLKEYHKTLELLFNEAKETKSFKEVEKFCKEHEKNSNQKIFEKFYQLLSEEVKKYQDIIDKAKSEEEIKKNEELKQPFEKAMLDILKNNGSIDTIDPMIVLDYANDHMNICQNKDFFNYLKKVVTNFTIEGNKYKIAKNLSNIGLAYKAEEDYKFKKEHVTIDSDKVCDLCQKKIGSTIFAVYPNLNVYHSKCAPNINIDPKTGMDFSKTNYIV